jgi:D-alanyl-D-alanine carboxypeptidase
MSDYLGNFISFFGNNIPIPPTNLVPILTKQNWPTQSQIWSGSIDGTPGDWGSVWYKENIVEVPCPWTLSVESTAVHYIQINKKCADSLGRVLNYIWFKVGKTQEAIEKLHYHLYDGSFNYRIIRGGSAPSMHSYGRAIDFDAAENAQHSQKHLFQDDSLIVTAFKGEGWIWGGDWSPGSIDGMHFQAAKVH